jgi:selenocysteine lyase/cysteine desulfurase
MNDLALVGADCTVQLADGRQRRYVNLDNAASTPPLRAVLDAVTDFMPWYSSVHRGAGHKSVVSTDRYERARTTVARFVGADLREHVVIFGRNTTEAINKLSYRLALERSEIVLISQLEHHSNDLPWRARARVLRIRADAQGALDEEHAARLLREHAGCVRLLAVTGGSNVTGHMPDIHRLATLAHAAGARILIDAAQLAPHRRIEMGAIDDPGHIDYLALSGHKMYAPFGVGALIGRRDTFEQGEPEMRGGGTIRFVSTDEVAWAAAPERDEAGTPNVVGAIALAAAIDVLERIGMDAIAAHEAALTAHALRGLARVPGVRIHGDDDPGRAQQRLGVVPFEMAGVKHNRVAARLAAEHAIGVRSGCFCAHPYLVHLLGLDDAQTRAVQRRLANDDDSDTPGLVRISFGIGNTLEDVDVLLAALRVIATEAGTAPADVEGGRRAPGPWNRARSGEQALASFPAWNLEAAPDPCQAPSETI